eukprot:4453913-Prymnesium_polylepis.1
MATLGDGPPSVRGGCDGPCCTTVTALGCGCGGGLAVPHINPLPPLINAPTPLLPQLAYVGHTLVVDAILHECGGVPAGEVWDIGCGTGLVGAALRAAPQASSTAIHRLVGIDVASEMVAAARGREG